MEHAALSNILSQECTMDEDSSSRLAYELIRGATAHHYLCLMIEPGACYPDLNIKLKKVRRWFDFRSAYKGISHFTFDHCVKQPMVYIVFKSGASNSQLGRWAIPLDKSKPGDLLLNCLFEQLGRLEHQLCLAQRLYESILSGQDEQVINEKVVNR